MCHSVEELDGKYDSCLIINEKEYQNKQTILTGVCSVCGKKWKTSVFRLINGYKCTACSKKKRLEEYRLKRLNNAEKKAKIYLSERNGTFIKIEEKGKVLYVNFFNHNKDTYGNEIGLVRMDYYSLLHGRKVKKEIGVKLSHTTEDWVRRAKETHPEYCYDKVKYINNRKSVIIICPKHGEFSVNPKAFMKEDYKCAKCRKEETITREGIEILKQIKEKYPYYDFSESVYNGNKKKIIVICPKHGKFKMEPYRLLNGSKCPKCSSEKRGMDRRTTLEAFVNKAKKIHGNKYDYLSIEHKEGNCYIHAICHEKDEFGCEHGEFAQLISSHLRGEGCSKCNNLYLDKNKAQERFIKRVKLKHPNLDFSKSTYTKNHDNIIVICHEKDEFGDEHGEFITTPHDLLAGHGCKKCARSFMDKEYFIKKARLIHGDKYDYSKVDYVNNHTNVIIVCPEHGEFPQTPGSHLNGRGCPLCKTSHIEREIKVLLFKNGINNIYQYHNKELLGKQSLDFFIEDLKLAIECQGEQHIVANFFKSKGVDYAEKHLEYIKSLDKKKREICEQNGIEIIYYVDKKIKHLFKNYIGKVFYDKKELLEYIKNKQNQIMSTNEE